MPRVLITGGSGLLGSALVRAARQEYEVSFTYHRHPVDLPGASGLRLVLEGERKPVAALLEASKPDVIIHTAGLRSLDYCETHPEEARRVNVEGTLRLAEAAAEHDIPFVFISTESVFDGTRGMYREDDVPNPITIYGRTKLEAEQSVRRLLPDALIVRTSSIYGRSQHGQSLAEYILEELADGRPLEMITDSAFSPILSDNLAEAILELVRTHRGGLYHVAGTERCSRYEFALAVAHVFGYDPGLIRPVTFQEVRARFDAVRPRDLSMNVSQAQAALRTTRLLTVNEGLKRFRSDVKKHGQRVMARYA